MSFYVGQKFYSSDEQYRAIREINATNARNYEYARNKLEREFCSKSGLHGYCFYDGAENNNKEFVTELINLGFKKIDMGYMSYTVIEPRSDYTTQIYTTPTIKTSSSAGYDGYTNSFYADNDISINYNEHEAHQHFLEIVNVNAIRRTHGVMYYPVLRNGYSYANVFNKVSALWAVRSKEIQVKTSKSKETNKKNDLNISEVIFRFMQFPICLAYVAIFIIGMIKGLEDIPLFYKIAPVSIAALYTLCYILGTGKMLVEKEQYMDYDQIDKIQMAAIMPIVMVLPYPLIFNWLNTGILAFIGILLIILWIGGFAYVIVNDFLGHLKFNVFTQFVSKKVENDRNKKAVQKAQNIFNSAGGDKAILNLRKEIKAMLK